MAHDVYAPDPGCASEASQIHPGGTDPRWVSSGRAWSVWRLARRIPTAGALRAARRQAAAHEPVGPGFGEMFHPGLPEVRLGQWRLSLIAVLPEDGRRAPGEPYSGTAADRTGIAVGIEVWPLLMRLLLGASPEGTSIWCLARGPLRRATCTMPKRASLTTTVGTCRDVA